MSSIEVRSIAATLHGRVLVRDVAHPRGILVGFHGYMETAALQMERLAAIAGSDGWTLIAIQGLHRFYKGGNAEVVASWMTRQDRDAMVADNIGYVDAAMASLAPAPGVPIVWSGFSQGVPMAYRAAVRGRYGAAGILAVGGEVPPEIAADAESRFPPVLLVRGERDTWFTQPTFDSDAATIQGRGGIVRTLVFDGAHEWTPAVGAAAGDFLQTLGKS